MKGSTEEIADGCSVYATPKGFGAKPRLGTVKQKLPKGAIVAFPDGTEDRFPDKKLKLASPARKPPKALEPLLATTPVRALPPVFFASELEGTPIVPLHKPERPEKRPAYLEWIRTWPCCNCQAPPRSDPHHQGKHPVGRKVRDTMAVPLCRLCHNAYTDDGCLPDPEGSNSGGQVALRGKEASLEILQRAQLRFLRMAWELMPREMPMEPLIEVMSRELAQIEDRVMAERLK